MPAELKQIYPETREVSPREAYSALDLASRTGGERPYIIANMVSSADGSATLGGKSSGISGDTDRDLFHTLRTQVDAVMVGTTTIAKENYGPLITKPAARELRAENGLEPVPVAITVTRNPERLPVDAPLFKDADSRVIVLTNSKAEPPSTVASVEVIRNQGPGIDLSAATAKLHREHSIRSILLEGGPTLLGTMLEAGILDELFLTISPLLAGGGPGPSIVEGPPLAAPASLLLASVLVGESALFLRYTLNYDRN